MYNKGEVALPRVYQTMPFGRFEVYWRTTRLDASRKPGKSDGLISTPYDVSSSIFRGVRADDVLRALVSVASVRIQSCGTINNVETVLAVVRPSSTCVEIGRAHV